MKSNYLRIENLLSEQENNQIFKYCTNNQHLFSQSNLTPPNPDGRSSKVIYDAEITNLITKKLEIILPLATNRLGINLNSYFLDAQITASGNDDFLMCHPDQTEIITNRIVTFIYYFHAIPQLFLGGGLVLYHSNNCGDLTGEYSVIEPTNNSLILFDSRLWHEVLRVRCPSSFAANRFTVNGWICRTGQ
jgi:Rps23 Pro-64 3,4-dihydroxylase Tpa1-like proline 4-hydroxylase